MTIKGKFAVDTTVTPDETLKEIRALLKRYNADKFAMSEEATHIAIAFEMCDRRVRFNLPLPRPEDFTTRANGAKMDSRQMKGAYPKAIRARWRSLLLVIKAKLESVESGIETFEQSFLAQIVLPDGKTMAEWAAPQIEVAYNTGKMPPLLPSGN